MDISFSAPRTLLPLSDLTLPSYVDTRTHRQLCSLVSYLFFFLITPGFITFCFYRPCLHPAFIPSLTTLSPS